MKLHIPIAFVAMIGPFASCARDSESHDANPTSSPSVQPTDLTTSQPTVVVTPDTPTSSTTTLAPANTTSAASDASCACGYDEACPGDGIRELALLEHGKTIFTATLKRGVGAADLPLASIPNYSVTGSFPDAAEAAGRSFLARVTVSSGAYLGAIAFNTTHFGRASSTDTTIMTPSMGFTGGRARTVTEP